MAINISISSLLSGNRTNLSLEIGEKHVKTLLSVALKFLIVVLPSIEPVITAVLSPYLSFI